jgi:polysaccharide export outer membrane protein
MAGGPNEFADKSHITLMRQSDRGVQALYVDLSDTKVLSSEYYYLLPNDIIYVPALKARPGRLNLEMLTILLTATTTAALLLSAINTGRR